MTAMDPVIDETREREPSAVSARFTALSESLSRLRSRGTDLPLARVLQWLGAILLPTGVVTIIIGWWGASHTPNLYEQNDYLISGGILGLGMVFAGGFMYFSYWLTRQLEVTKEMQQQALGNQRRLERQLEQLAAATTSLAVALGGKLPAGVAVGAQPTDLVATGSGALAHRRDCPVIARRGNIRALSADELDNYEACKVCAPYDTTAPAGGPR